MSIRESVIEKTVCQWAKDHGISNLKLEGMNNVGKPDRLFMRGGKVAFCEFKAKGKLPTALQEQYLLDRRRDGFHAEYFDNSPHAIAWLVNIFL